MKTNIHSVLCVAIRLGALLTAVGIVEHAPTIFMYPSGEGFSRGALWLSGAGLALAFMLWLLPNVLARWAVGRGSHELLEFPISADQIQRIAFSVVGVWLFIAGLAGVLARGVMLLVIAHRSAYGDPSRILSSSDWYWLVEHFATAVAGACLAVGSAGLVRLFHRVRGYPYRADKDDDVSQTQDS
jgi:hypothetical protein